MRTASLFHHTAYTIDTTDTTDTTDATDTVDTANQSGRFTTDRRVMPHNTFASDVRSHFECYKENISDNILSEMPPIINSGFHGRKVVTKHFFIFENLMK